MDSITIPKGLHDVFGERQTPASLAMILAAGLAGGAAFLLEARGSLASLGALRVGLATLLALDIAAGSAANFSRGTSDYYAARPRLRLLFIAVHVHLPLLALLMDWPLPPFLAAWAYCVLASLAVNARIDRRPQGLAGGLLALALVAASLLPGVGPAGRSLVSLFALKLVYAFAVDHYRDAPGPGRS